jgi:hypothetical protein
VVVILDKTFSFHAAFALSSRVARVLSVDISSSIFRQACAEEMNDTPTFEVTVVELKENTAPSRAVDVKLVDVLYAARVVANGAVPTKVLNVAGLSKYPQK